MSAQDEKLMFACPLIAFVPIVALSCTIVAPQKCASAEPPQSDEEARTEFGNWLHLAAARRKLVLIIDGLDHLDAAQGAHELDWIPSRLPENVRLIVACRDGASARAVTKLGWQTVAVHPLDHRGGTSERETLIRDFLLLYGKEMDRPRAMRLATTRPYCLTSSSYVHSGFSSGITVCDFGVMALVMVPL